MNNVIRYKLFFLILATAFLVNVFFANSSSPSSGVQKAKVSQAVIMTMRVHPKNILELQRCFEANAYDLKCPQNKVPPLVVAHFPKNMVSVKDASTRKETFIQAVLPLILVANYKVSQEREKLMELKAKATLTVDESTYLSHLCKKYQVNEGDLEELLKRVDIVPASMALAQAAIETGWGTSSAVRRKNALFGVTLPSGVKSYKCLEESTHAYLRNLNTHRAYREMRQKRALMREAGGKLCAQALMETLIHYCEYKGYYVRYVKNMMRENKLDQYDHSVLIPYALLAKNA